MNVKVSLLLAELRVEMQRLYGPKLRNLILFGSHARGEAVDGSDVDVLVVLDGAVAPGKEIERSGGIAAQLSLKYSILLSCAFMSAARYSIDKTPFTLNVKREGVTV